MNEQFVSTLLALESAKHEVHRLHDTLGKLESGDLAASHETATISRYQTELDCMVDVVSSMLQKRETAILKARTQKTG